jgi:hypothetical protein
MNALPSPETRALYERIKVESPTPQPIPAIPASRENQENQENQADKMLPGGANRAALLDRAGGAVPLDSALYVERPADRLFHEALLRVDSIVLVTGPRQVGKTSLLARGIQRARGAGCRVATTDLQKLADPQRHLGSSEAFLLALGRQLARRLGLDARPDADWEPDEGPSENFERFLRTQVLDGIDRPLVWALDEVDQLFGYRWATEVFSLFRSWHNERALEPDGPWGKLTLAMAYATEAHLFITDLNQSPFNVGTKITLEDFTEGQLADLDRRLGNPLGSVARRDRFVALVGGHPDLVRRGLQELAAGGVSMEELEGAAARDDGPFGQHLRRLVHSLGQDQELCGVVLGLLRAGRRPDLASFHRLRSAGVVSGEDPSSARARCGLYARYLGVRLAEGRSRTPPVAGEEPGEDLR